MKQLEKINNLKPRKTGLIEKLLILRAVLSTDEKYQEFEAKVIGSVLGVITFAVLVLSFRIFCYIILWL